MCGRVMVDMFGNRSSRRSAQFMVCLVQEMKASRTWGITNGSWPNASKSPHGVAPLDVFVPVEHPSEPLDVDQPMQCPRPEPGIMHDGRIWKERILAARARRRAELLGEIPPFTNGPNW
ncbi:hypothetical protein BDL97_01G177200 [Sphagnum fallax]|nr:hypothetical protein BDL97_01G177200 [Sphagnum fallax]KAH8975774.1 hypothetical protein BDL97_01G177200 [Sphagnum fallax]